MPWTVVSRLLNSPVADLQDMRNCLVRQHFSWFLDDKENSLVVDVLECERALCEATN